MNKMNMLMTGVIVACSIVSAGCQDDPPVVKTPILQQRPSRKHPRRFGL